MMLFHAVGLKFVKGPVEGEAVVNVLLYEILSEVDAFLVLLAVAVLLNHVQQLHQHVRLRPMRLSVCTVRDEQRLIF